MLAKAAQPEALDLEQVWPHVVGCSHAAVSCTPLRLQQASPSTGLQQLEKKAGTAAAHTQPEEEATIMAYLYIYIYIYILLNFTGPCTVRLEETAAAWQLTGRPQNCSAAASQGS